MTKTLTQKLKRKQAKQSEKVVYEPRMFGPKPQQQKSTVTTKSNGVVTAPVAATKIVSGSKPALSRAFRVSHRELVGTFVNNTVFQVNGGIAGNVYRVNPTNSGLFSWLPAIASNFDRYRFLALSFEYIPMCATTETGRVALYHDPDSQDNEPTDRVELANQWHLSETAPWCATTLTVPVDQTIRYTQDSNVTDTKLVDFGQFGFVVYNGPGANVVGDVFVHYTIELLDPQPTATLVETLQSGTGGVIVGPNYAQNSTDAATFKSFIFRSPGVYVVSFAIRGTAFSNFTGSTVTINSSTVQVGVSAIMGLVTLTCSAPGQLLGINGTAMTTYTVEITRAKVVNVTNLI